MLKNWHNYIFDFDLLFLPCKLSLHALFPLFVFVIRIRKKRTYKFYWASLSLYENDHFYFLFRVHIKQLGNTEVWELDGPICIVKKVEWGMGGGGDWTTSHGK